MIEISNIELINKTNIIITIGVNNMRIGDRIRKLRIELGIDQKELAERIGVANSTISRLESGQKTPSRETTLKLANILGCTTDYLITGQENKQDELASKLINIFQRNGIIKEDIDIDKLEKVMKIYKLMDK